MGRTGETPLPHWDAQKHTWIEVINSIDRERGVAAENHLAHHATVPAGVGFQVLISGQFTERDEDIPLLLAALEGFNDKNDPIRLGADTASGKGRMRWELEAIYHMDAAGVAAWVADSKRGMAHRSLAAIGPERRAELLKKAKEIIHARGHGVTSQ
jgi:CRISPR/Cas system CSM-associated protein Csm3 (group 7 of RAMP superfamily)